VCRGSGRCCLRRVGAVILAAGASTRLGRPKQLVVLGGERMLERAVRVAAEVCGPVVVVLGAHAELITRACLLDGATVVVNHDWNEGMGSSIRCGVMAGGDVDGMVVMTCDMPAVTAGHLRLLIESGVVTASGYAGRRGVPAYFPAEAFSELLRLQGEGGAREMLRHAAVVELALGEVDVDSLEDVERARALFGGI
jgi:molybdenum cofactor cytidylyltransferase